MRKDEQTDKSFPSRIHFIHLVWELRNDLEKFIRSIAYIGHFVGNVRISNNVSNIKEVHLFSKSSTENFPVVENKSLELFIHGDVLSLSDIRRSTDGRTGGRASCTYRLLLDGYCLVCPTQCNLPHVIWMATFNFFSLNLHFSVEITVMMYEMKM
jgi:hypothetical protein